MYFCACILVCMLKNAVTKLKMLELIFSKSSYGAHYILGIPNDRCIKKLPCLLNTTTSGQHFDVSSTCQQLF